jgi:hypothetical protein
VLDKGKGKMVKPEKPKKLESIPLWVGVAFNIYKPKDPVPLAPPVIETVKRSPY